MQRLPISRDEQPPASGTPAIHPDVLAALKSGIAACSTAPQAPVISQALLSVWVKVFASSDVRDMSKQEVEAAFLKHKQYCKWFPQESEILDNIRSARRALAEARRREIDQREALPERGMPEEERAQFLAERDALKEKLADAGSKLFKAMKMADSDEEEARITKEDQDRFYRMASALKGSRR